MNNYPELAKAAALYHKQTELEDKIREIRTEIEQNEQEIIKSFFPYLLSVYEKWRPAIGEVAINMCFDRNICFDITIRTVDGYYVRAQEGDKPVFCRFELNPVLKEYEVANFIIPKQNYEEIKDFFDLIYKSH